MKSVKEWLLPLVNPSSIPHLSLSDSHGLCLMLHYTSYQYGINQGWAYHNLVYEMIMLTELCRTF